MTLMYDERSTLDMLRRLPSLFRTVYAASAATRLLPAFSRVSAETSAYASPALGQIVDQLWTDLERRHLSETDLRSLLNHCMSLLPEEAQGRNSDRLYAEDAVASVAYAIRSRVTGSAEEAVWAGRRAYEALDQYAINDLDLSFDDPDAETRLAAHPAVQIELRHQQDDLSDLVVAQQLEDRGVLQRLRERAFMSAYRFLSPSTP